MRKCAICGDPIVNGTGYVALGYAYHDRCFPRQIISEKQRCFYCHKILRKGDESVCLGDIGVGGYHDRMCMKCADKHFGDEKER